jgi:hypothetical protein
MTIANFLIHEYLWLLIDIILMVIDDYFINGYFIYDY